MSLCIVFTTTPDTQTAQKIASALVEKNLAGCVKQFPEVTSTYAWQGNVEIDKECQLLIKTTRHTVDKAFECVSSLHPYDVPEWIVINDVTASQDYGKWLAEQTDMTRIVE
ncbi:divalent-cation tolerance protein CutA [Salinimonas chungwhensis]|uniref:divalent-cation tolerance protein CutA n=1 Tax=Salinimonas chungwhensis TaxID=265425 RepID=UPI000364A603|nr:divalent-cation tolerance protein CutA [Salinimonas chungwhensis]